MEQETVELSTSQAWGYVEQHPDVSNPVQEAMDSVQDATGWAIVDAISAYRQVGMDGFVTAMADAAQQAVTALPRRAVTGIDAWWIVLEFSQQVVSGDYSSDDEERYGDFFRISERSQDHIHDTVEELFELHRGRPGECGSGCPALRPVVVSINAINEEEMMAFQPVGYVYDADTHCVGHAHQRFGSDQLQPGADLPQDFEGNQVTPVYSWEMSEHHQDEDGNIQCSECVWEEVSSRNSQPV